MKPKQSILLDTSFFLRLLNEDDSLFKNADDYFHYFLELGMDVFISTISIAEYCVGGKVDELPLRNLKILPFNFNHAKRAGEFGKIAFSERKAKRLEVSERVIIPNDIKLFAQADCEKTISYYLSSDTESMKIFNAIKHNTTLTFEFLDLNKPYNAVFGILPFE